MYAEIASDVPQVLEEECSYGDCRWRLSGLLFGKLIPDFLPVAWNSSERSGLLGAFIVVAALIAGKIIYFVIAAGLSQRGAIDLDESQSLRPGVFFATVPLGLILVALALQHALPVADCINDLDFLCWLKDVERFTGLTTLGSCYNPTYFATLLLLGGIFDLLPLLFFVLPFLQSLLSCLAPCCTCLDRWWHMGRNEMDRVIGSASCCMCCPDSFRKGMACCLFICAGVQIAAQFQVWG